jgi:hypothetical protein
MCFSAPASFIASAGLMVIGTIAIRKSKTTPQRILAAMPIVFAVQQLSEGILWLSLSQPAYSTWYTPAMYVFLFFAQIVWPTYVPLSILLLEEKPQRKKILTLFLTTGLLISGYFLYCLFFYKVSATITNHHIYYDLRFPLANKWLGGLLYIVAAVFSPFFSGQRPLRWVGVILLVAYLFSRIVYADYIVSIWCFFAAILSVVILAIIHKLNKA